MLTVLGCSFTVVADGVEALAEQSTSTYDLVLLDILMLRMDWVQTARTIVPRFGEYLVALTADVVEDHRATYRAAGIDPFFSKLLRLAALRTQRSSRLIETDGPA